MLAADRPGQKGGCAERGVFSLAPSIRPVELVALHEVRYLTTWDFVRPGRVERLETPLFCVVSHLFSGSLCRPTGIPSVSQVCLPKGVCRGASSKRVSVPGMSRAYWSLRESLATRLEVLSLTLRSFLLWARRSSEMA